MENTKTNNTEDKIAKDFDITSARHLNFDRPQELFYAVYEPQPLIETEYAKAPEYGLKKLFTDFKKPETTDKATAYRNIIEEVRKHR